jgi:hypothetical protein
LFAGLVWAIDRWKCQSISETENPMLY